MKMRHFSLSLVLLFVLVVVGRGQTSEPSSTDARPRTVAQTQLPATTVIPFVNLSEDQEPTPLRLLSGRSLVVNSPQVLKRVSVSDPSIASAIIVNPNQVLINGLTPGRVTLLLWNEREQPTAYDLLVEIDISGLRTTMAQVFPN